MRPLKIALITFFVVGSAGLAWIVSQVTRPSQVPTITPCIRDITNQRVLVGTLAPSHEVRIESPLTGTIAQHYVAVGDSVQPGPPWSR